jgi:replicative DNA helicase
MQRKPEEIIQAHPGGVNGFFSPDNTSVGIRAPWPSLQDLLGGFKPSQLTVIAARTPGSMTRKDHRNDRKTQESCPTKERRTESEFCADAWLAVATEGLCPKDC